jgi:KDO2-lipid IV(A) lauroyltransferase
MGGAVGRCVASLDKKQGRTAHTNLQACFPELTDAERETLLRNSFVSAGKTLLESIWMWKNPPSETLKRVERVVGREHFQAASAAGKGVIIAGPHIGNWEVIGLWLGAKSDCMSMYRPPRQKQMEALMSQGREASGAKLVPADASGVRWMMRHLKGGGVCGILPDQEPGKGEGVFAPFFGIPAYTMVLLVRLAVKTGCPVLVGYAKRTPAGGFEIHFEPVSGLLPDTSVEQGAAILNLAVEQAVRSCPDQYLWSYKRFKTRPPGEPRFYLAR